MGMYKSGIKNTSVIENKNFNRSRPSSAYSHRQNISSMNKTTRPSSSKNRISVHTENDYINSGINPMEDNLIFDDEEEKMILQINYNLGPLKKNFILNLSKS